MFFIKRRQESKDAVQLILNFVEGRTTIQDFHADFLTSKKLQTLLKKKFDLDHIAYKQYNYNSFDYFQNEWSLKDGKWNTVEAKYTVFIELKRWLTWFEYPFTPYEKYEEDYNYILSIQPSWLNIIDDQGIFDKILQERPVELSKAKQIAWGKARIKELFRYDKTYPRWIQDAEWPIINGKPLVFSHQSKEKKDDERVYYYFYDPDTMEQTVVEQFY